MIEAVNAAPIPRVGTRVRWHDHSGTNFGRVVSIDEPAGMLIARVEDGVREATLPVGKVVVLSASGGAR